jgi:predicted dehydrogenase
MKIGIMSFAHLHAEAYIHNIQKSPGVELVGLADAEASRGRQFAQAYDTHYYPEYPALLEAADAVIICSENVYHRPLAEMAAAAGVHVLCEKPLATTLADAQAIIDACRSAGVTLMTAFPMRFSAPIVQLKQNIDQGNLGKVYLYATTNQGRMPINERAWFVDKELAGGGAVMDHTVHLADILRWYTGSEVGEVYAQTNHIMHAETVEVETAGLIMLTFADGTIASIDASWSKPLNYPTWGGLTMEVVAERGLTVIDAFSQNLNRYTQQPATNNWLYWGSDADQGLVDEFAAAVREGRTPQVTGEDGYQAVAIALAAYQSAASGQPVNLSS